MQCLLLEKGTSSPAARFKRPGEGNALDEISSFTPGAPPRTKQTLS